MLRLTKYLKPYALMAMSVVVLVFLQVLADLKLPNLMATIVDGGIMKGNTGLIWDTGKVMLLIALGGAVCAVIAGYFSSRTSVGLGRDLRGKVFSHVESFSLHEFDKIGTASLITRTTNDVTQIQMVMMLILNMVVRAPVMCIGGVVMALSEDARLSWILAAVIPVVAAVVVFLASMGLPLFSAMQKKIDRLNLVLREGLTGVRVIRAFNREDHEARRFDDANRDLTQNAIRVYRLMNAAMPVMMLTMNFTTIAIMWAGSHRVDAGTLEVGRMMAFIQYAMQILMSLLMVSMIFVMLPRAAASADRINQVLDSVPEIVDKEEATKSDSERGHIEFKDVSFSYPGAEAPALSHVSFKAGPGQVTAILGGTGSGKSTLVSLIPRFYDVSSGQVLVDGVDVREMTQEDLRARIGFVPQKAVLFSGTVADNVRFGKLDATDEEVRHATETAQALDFVSEMKEGFNSLIAQGGTNVSGGQKQRLSIARALVRRPEICVFDDSFSAVDFKTDANLRAALKSETKDATVIIVAQRVSTVMGADRIVVLDEGAVAGIGTHKQLMKTCEVYREIVLSQLSEEEIA